MRSIRDALGFAAAYRWLQMTLGGNARQRYIEEYVQPQPGQRVLDIGCGTGECVALFPKVDYLGIDLSPKYIHAANLHYGHLGRFITGNVDSLSAQQLGQFDLVMANGVLHHLNDQQVQHLLRVARQVLRPGGRLVTLDACWIPNQSLIARCFLHLDRGEYIRTAEGYQQLAQNVFPMCQAHIRHNLMRIPYTHIILVCPQKAAAAVA